MEITINIPDEELTQEVHMAVRAMACTKAQYFADRVSANEVTKEIKKHISDSLKEIDAERLIKIQLGKKLAENQLRQLIDGLIDKQLEDQLSYMKQRIEIIRDQLNELEDDY